MLYYSVYLLNGHLRRIKLMAYLITKVIPLIPTYG